MRPYPDVPVWIRPSDWEFIAMTLPDRDKRKSWTDEDIQRLIDLRKTHTIKEISTIMDRGYYGLIAQCKKINLRKIKRRDDYEE